MAEFRNGGVRWLMSEQCKKMECVRVCGTFFHKSFFRFFNEISFLFGQTVEVIDQPVNLRMRTVFTGNGVKLRLARSLSSDL